MAALFSVFPAIVMMLYSINYFATTSPKYPSWVLTAHMIIIIFLATVIRDIILKMSKLKEEKEGKAATMEMDCNQISKNIITVLNVIGDRSEGVNGEQYAEYHDDLISIYGTPESTNYDSGRMAFSVFSPSGGILLYSELEHPAFLKQNFRGDNEYLKTWTTHLDRLAKDCREKVEDDRFNGRDLASKEAIRKAREATDSLRDNTFKRELLEAIELISDQLTMQKDDVIVKGYEDNKLRIQPGDHRVIVSIHQKKNWVPVYHITWDANDHIKEVDYHPGRWVNYILDVLAPRAKAAKQEEQDRIRREQEKHFSPIDDLNLFRDVV